MAKHRSITLHLRQDKAENVYRYVERWEAHPSSQGEDVYYLLIVGVFQWGQRKENPVQGFSVAMQYSTTIGEDVDVSQPAHIHQDDAARVADAFAKFVKRGAR